MTPNQNFMWTRKSHFWACVKFSIKLIITVEDLSLEKSETKTKYKNVKQKTIQITHVVTSIPTSQLIKERWKWRIVEGWVTSFFIKNLTFRAFYNHDDGILYIIKPKMYIIYCSLEYTHYMYSENAVNHLLYCAEEYT